MECLINQKTNQKINEEFMSEKKQEFIEMSDLISISNWNNVLLEKFTNADLLNSRLILIDESDSVDKYYLNKILSYQLN